MIRSADHSPDELCEGPLGALDSGPTGERGEERRGGEGTVEGEGGQLLFLESSHWMGLAGIWC